MRSQLDVAESLQELGLTAIFAADPTTFDGLTEEEIPLGLGSVVHESFLAIDEEGTEAAAATAMAFAMAAPFEEPVPPLDFVVDRPFAFVLRHEGTGLELFVGQVCEPI